MLIKGQTQEAAYKAELREEKCYPNKSVIGKYIYKDNEGNPVQVKYYADKTGYGVELKSVRVVGASVTDGDRNGAKESPLTARAEARENFKNKATDKGLPDILSDETKRTDEGMYKEKGNKRGSKEGDYEVFLNREPKTPRSVKNKEKYRIYLRKNKRNAELLMPSVGH